MRYRVKALKPTKLGYNIQRLMSERGLKSGTKLAEELNIPAPSINRILSGQITDPRLSTVVLIADYFEISVDDLIGR